MAEEKKPKTLIFGMDVKDSTGKPKPKQGVADDAPEKKKVAPKKKNKNNKTSFFGD